MTNFGKYFYVLTNFPHFTIKNEFTISLSKNIKQQFTVSPSKNGKYQFTISQSKNGNEHFTISGPESLTQLTEVPEEYGKGHIPDYTDLDSPFSDSPSKKKKRDKKKDHRKHRKYDSSDPSLSDDSDSSDDNYYRRKQCKRKNDQINDPIKLCAGLTANLLTTAYKSKIIWLKWMRIRSSAEFIFSHL